MRIAVVDDGPTEHFLLRELGVEVLPGARFEGFLRLEDFLGGNPKAYDHVFLDRRLGRFEDHDQSLPLIAAAGYRGHVILMSAFILRVEPMDLPFRVSGPVDKLELLKPAVLAACVKIPAST